MKLKNSEGVMAVEKKDMPLPRYLWYVLKNTTRAERLSCAIALFFVIVFNVLIVLYFTVFITSNDVIDVAPHEWQISREMWLAEPYNATDPIALKYEPLRLVVIQHTAGNECATFIKCAAEIRNLQQYYLSDKGYDIPYNFLVGNDGRVYEGIGWSKVGAHTKGYNSCSLGIGFTGDYREEKTGHFTAVTTAQLNRTQMLLEEGVKLGHLHPQYLVEGAKDLRPSESPGSNLYKFTIVMEPDTVGLRQDRLEVFSTISKSVSYSERVLTAAIQETPSVAETYVTQCKNVHVGDKIKSVTNNIQSNNVVRGQFVCLELVSPSESNRMRCSIAVFICWATVVALGLATTLCLVVSTRVDQTTLDIGLNEKWYLRRIDWLAQPASRVEVLFLPVKFVIIGHTATGYCNDTYQCTEQVMALQQNHLRRYFDDIMPNFLATANGMVFEGRGANIVGQLLNGWDTTSISVLFVGDYRSDVPTEVQIDHVETLLNKLVDIQVLQQDYEVYGRCQIATFTVSPGWEIMKVMFKLTHWNDLNFNTCE